MHMFSWPYMYSVPTCAKFALRRRSSATQYCASRGVSVTGGFECKRIFFSRIAIGPVSVCFIRLSLVCHPAFFRETCFELDAMETIPTSRVWISRSSKQRHGRRTTNCSWNTGCATLCTLLKCCHLFSYPFPEVNFLIDRVNL